VLPPITDTGANTFGCLIDGKVFVPQKPAFSTYEILQCNYQLVGGVQYLVLSGGDFVNNNGVSLFTENIVLKADTILKFDDPNHHLAYAYFYGSGNREDYKTLDSTNGICNIKHFDPYKQIISGTFWFDATDTATGKVVHITDGRFDVHYTL